jgi:uncharacterized tellurite resistance protein B-like protein
LYEIAESGILGGMEQVEQSNMWRFIDILSIKRTHDLIKVEQSEAK